ncbi:MAG: Fe-Mn family superoxide dismutase [Patescibacteria group bacterium]
MQTFTQKIFNINNLKGISSKNIEEHLKLYAGYVKNTNMLLEKISELSKDETTNAYLLGELQRRFSFEFCGMRNHEYYFGSFENGSLPLNQSGQLAMNIEKNFGSFDAWLSRFKAVAMTRGIGWAILYYDKKTKQLLNQWVDEHHLGQLASLSPILCLDMWEHAYVYDYPTSEKKKYVEAFFENLNWSAVENYFTEAQ